MSVSSARRLLAASVAQQARIDAALALHVTLDTAGSWCVCGQPYPCATRRALTGCA